MAKHIVVYSAGPDSTLLLDRLADPQRIRSPEDPETVLAFSMDGHPQIEPRQLEGQRVAAGNYARWARKNGRKYDHHAQRLLDEHGSSSAVGELPQAMLWFLSVMPYVGQGDQVHFGYIRGDDFWHYRDRFVTAFQAVCALKCVTATLHFDLEWLTKDDVVGELRARGVPKNALWTCEDPTRHGGAIACGRCSKCTELAKALANHPRIPRARRKENASDHGDLARLTREVAALPSEVQREGGPAAYEKAALSLGPNNLHRMAVSR